MSADQVVTKMFLGHIYVAEFDSGVVKVGKTRSVQRRMAEHAKGAAIHGASITRSWASPAHVGYDDNETALIDFCTARMPAELGAEYFRGLDFDEVVQFAAGLTFSTDPPVVASQEAARGARGMLAALAPGAELLRRIHTGELVCVERKTWDGYERSFEMLSEMTEVLERLGTATDGTYKAVVFMLAAIDGQYGVLDGDEPDPRHYEAASAVLELLGLMRAPRLGAA